LFSRIIFASKKFEQTVVAVLRRVSDTPFK
jgi:hypothetical protein